MSQHDYMRHTATPPLVLDLIRLSQSASCGKTINFYLLVKHALRFLICLLLTATSHCIQESERLSCSECRLPLLRAPGGGGAMTLLRLAQQLLVMVCTRPTPVRTKQSRLDTIK